MRRFFLTIFLLLSITLSNAQNYHVIDSLKRALATAQEDTNKVNIYSQLGWQYQWSYPDSALSYAMPGLALARKLRFDKGEFSTLFNMAEALSTKGNYTKSLELRFQYLELAKRVNNPEEMANALASIGSVYYYSKDYQKALRYFYQAKAYNTVIFGIPELIYGFIGENYFHLNQIDSAFFYIKKAYDLDVNNTAHHWSTPYFYLGAIYEKRNSPAKAIELYRTGVNVGTDKIDILDGYNGMASAFRHIYQMDSSIFYAKKTVIEGLDASLPSPVIEASTLLTTIYKSTHNTDSAFKYQNIMLAAKDSLFSQEKVKQLQNIAFDEQIHQQEIETAREEYRNKMRLYSLIIALAVFITIGVLLWRNNQHKQKAYALLQKQKEETDKQREKAELTLQELKATQAQLIQSEKMASLGELTAGIAHEIQNPLNFVNNFSEVNTELITEMEEELNSGNIKEALAVANDIRENEQKIKYHGERADAIVKGMLQHSRKSTGQKERTDINRLADEYLRLSYYGLRAKDKSFNAVLETHFDESIGSIPVIPQDIGRVLLNLFNNAFYSVTAKKKQLNGTYEPTVSISTQKCKEAITIAVRDNGVGISQKILDKIFQPFFTTKPTGEGTGLGLSLSHDIIKAHGGTLKVNTEEGKYAEFVIQLPA